MQQAKQYAIRLLTPITHIIPVKVQSAIAGNRCILPFYHTVSDINLPHISQLYNVKTIADFESDLDYLLSIAQPISLSELISVEQNAHRYKKPVFHLSFDDGLAEFYEVIAPILVQKGIPATCFLNSDFIDNQSLFYRFKASLIINKLRQEKTGSVCWKNYHIWANKHAFKSSDYKVSLKSVSYNQTTLLDELAALLEIDFESYLKENKPYLSTNQIENLIHKGFT
jgi:hypothetical protein